MIKNYAPKAGPVQAIQVEQTNLEEVADWCGGEIRTTNNGVHVPSIQGGSYASIGEYVVKEGNRFRVESAVAFQSKYKEVGLRQDGIVHINGNIKKRSVGGSGEAYGDYPDYRYQEVNKAYVDSLQTRPSGWGKHADSP